MIGYLPTQRTVWPGGRTLQAVIGCHLVHHFFIVLVLQAVCAVRVEQMVGDTIACICVQGHLQPSVTTRDMKLRALPFIRRCHDLQCPMRDSDQGTSETSPGCPTTAPA